jgi:hypothetical protein
MSARDSTRSWLQQRLDEAWVREGLYRNTVSLAFNKKDDTMRTMIRWMVPAEQGNQSIANGAMQESIESMLRDLKPEAAYFFANGGKRGGMMIFDMADPSQIPQIAEPLFQTFHAEVEFLPVMNAEDLQRAFSKL